MAKTFSALGHRHAGLRKPVVGVHVMGTCKSCTKCGRHQPLFEFGADRTRGDGRFPQCRECNRVPRKPRPPALTPEEASVRKRERERAYMKSRRGRNKRMKSTYGITVSEWEKMYVEQRGRCAICGDLAKLHIDHDHVTGAVRALLCQCCNQALGFLRDDPVRLRAAIDYLERFST